MNKKKKLENAVLNMMKAGAHAENKEELRNALMSLPRKDRRILDRMSKKIQEKKAKQQLEDDHGSIKAGNLQEHEG